MGRARILTTRGIAAFALTLVVACAPASGTARGPVVSVEGDLSEVTAFTVLVEGDEWRFLPVAEADYDFPLGHLREHQRTGEVVLVDWELRGDARYALSILDG